MLGEIAQILAGYVNIPLAILVDKSMKALDLFEGTMRDGKRKVTDIGIVASALRFACRTELVLLQPSVSKTF